MTSFRPPSARQWSQWLSMHAPQALSPWRLWMPLLIFAPVLLITSLLPGPLALLTPWLLVGGLLVFLHLRQRRLARLEQQVRQLGDWTLLRHHVAVLRQGWGLLPQLTTLPPMHHQVVGLMTQALDHCNAHESALIGFDHLLEHLPDTHLSQGSLRAGRGLSALLADRLNEADDAIRQLDRMMDDPQRRPGHPMAGLSRLLEITYAALTYHHEDVTAMAANLVETLRPLGLHAAYGHALMAWSFHELNQRAGEQAPAEQGALSGKAQSHWACATALMPVTALCWRFPQLRTVAGQLEAREIRDG